MVVRKALSIAAALLIAFHAWLFLRDLWEGQLADVALLARWLAAGAVVWAMVRLRRQGVSLLWGRQAVAIWSLAALLHGPALQQGMAARDDPAVPNLVVTLTQVTVAAGLIVFVLFGLHPARRRLSSRHVTGTRISVVLIGALPPDSFFSFNPRPPPIVA